MLQVWRALLLSLLLANAGYAGPWAREEGEVFVSLSTERDRDENSFSSLYGEYGLTPRNTLGFELTHGNSGESTAMLWLQRSMDQGEGPNRWTLSTGLGMLRRDGTYIPMAEFVGAWGRGFDSVPGLRDIPGGGWIGLETRIKIAGTMRDQDQIQELASTDAGVLNYITPETTLKTELTLGWHATDSLMLINQLRFEKREDTGFSSEVAVSAVRDLWGPAKLELGLIGPISGQGEPSIKLGTWYQF